MCRCHLPALPPLVRGDAGIQTQIGLTVHVLLLMSTALGGAN